jgi:hypothetical protein
VSTTTHLGMPEWWTRLSRGSEGGDQAAGEQTILLSFMGYFWWLLLGGVAEILFGGIYFGTKKTAALHLSTPVLQLIYVLVGILMIEVALGILKLRAWVFWGAFLMTGVLAALAITELVRWINGAPLTVEVGVFTILNIVFAAYNIFFLLQPGVRSALRQAAPQRKGQFSPDLVICGVIVTLPALSAALLLSYLDTHLSDPVLGLVYIGGGALMIFMAYGALAKHTWSWVVTWVWVGILVALSITLIVRRATGDGISTEGLIASIASLLFAASAVYYLLRDDVRRTFIHWRPKNPLFNPLFLIAGLALTGFAIMSYLLPGEVGTQAVAYAVPGLVIGLVVGLLPNSDPVTKLMGFVLGLMLAESSYLVRGGLLPYTKTANVIIVPLMLLIITGIAALFRSTAWFVSMLLGAGTLYGLVELEFLAAPSAYLATSTLAFISIFFSFGIGYMVSVLLGLTLSPPSAATPEADVDPGTHSPETRSSQAHPTIPSESSAAADSQGATDQATASDTAPAFPKESG